MRRVLASAIALSSFALVAQQPATAPAKPAAPAKMEMPKPGPEMERLKDFVGSFRVDEHHEAGFAGPASSGAGYNRIAMGPGGFSITIDYTTLSGVGHGMKGHGILGWDETSKAYKQVWTDSMGPMITVSTGNWEGDTLVMRSEGSFMGKPYKEEDVFSAISPEGFTLTINMSMEGAPMQKVMTLSHHRNAPRVAAPKAEAPKAEAPAPAAPAPAPVAK